MSNENKSKKEIKLLKDIKDTLIICKEQFIDGVKHLKWWQIVLIVFSVLLIAGVITVSSYAQDKYEKLDTEVIVEEDIVVNENVEIALGTGYTNFVVFGSDSRSENVDKNLNTDTIIIVSLNNETKEVRMVSVYRDTLLDIGDRNIQKCNSAYARGGAAQAISMLNNNLDLNIKKYVTVNFGAVADVVDMLGGIEVDVSEAEMKAMNKYIKETASIIDGTANLIEKAGVQNLDGVQAVTYSRIRKGCGDDFARTERQREVIQQIYKKVLTSNLSTINSIIDAVLPQISTNFTMSEIVAYASNFLNYSFGDTSGFPFEKNTGTVGKRGSCVYATTLEQNVKTLHEMLFDDLAYQPSEEVHKISIEISYLVTASGKSPSTSDSTKKETETEEKEEAKEEKEETKQEEVKQEETKSEEKEDTKREEKSEKKEENKSEDKKDDKKEESASKEDKDKSDSDKSDDDDKKSETVEDDSKQEESQDKVVGEESDKEKTEPDGGNPDTKVEPEEEVQEELAEPEEDAKNLEENGEEEAENDAPAESEDDSENPEFQETEETVE